ncbi:unnamed protein product [Penicillium camemberti]|uniref:Str. FM013 n=1 Tax=Penicillium camemberti (strain FM 013) TaxID=1429867 RepID=A0A0G4PTM7_PENC3|nr:unnamed protein product [Penicillium camemberti]
MSYIARLRAATAMATETLKPISKRDTMTHQNSAIRLYQLSAIRPASN